MFRILTTGLALALVVSPAAAFADDHGNGKSHSEKGNGKSHDDDGDHSGQSKRGHDDKGDHYHNQNNYGGYKGQRYAWQGSANDRSSWNSYRNYNYYRPAPGQTHYYANQYYRDGSYYQPRNVASNERIYRGQDNQYYCRRSDGTTGLIIGGLSGGTLGATLAPGGSQTLGALIGGTLGAVIGSSIDKGKVMCR